MKEFSTNELRLRVAHLLHRIVSMQVRINKGEKLDDFEIFTVHDDIYKLIERPD